MSHDFPYPHRFLEDQSLIFQSLSTYILSTYGALHIDHPLPPCPDAAEQKRKQVEHRMLMKNRFWSVDSPAINYVEYIRRIQVSMPKLETNVLLALPIYAQRLTALWTVSSQHQWPPSGLLLGCNLIHRFTIAAICLASKALGDQYYSNAFCAAVGGIGCGELYGLELELAARLEWNLQCSIEEYAWSWNQLSNLAL